MAGITTHETINDPQFDVFHNIDADASASGCWMKIVNPIESLDNECDIRFEIDANDKYWMAWGDSYMTMEATVLKTKAAGGTENLPVEEKMVFINNAAHSIFQDVKVKINYNAVEGGNNMYPWLAYMNNHIQFNQASKGTHMISQGYHMPVTNPNGKDFTNADNSTNAALITSMSQSKYLTFSFPLKVNLFQQGKSCPPGFKVDITLVRSPSKFVCLNLGGGTNTYVVNIRKAQFHMPMIHPNNHLQAQIANARKNKSILYQFNNLNCYRQTIVRGTQEKEFNNIFQNKQPKLAIFAFVKSDIYNKNERKFIFKNPGLDTVALKTEGRLITGEPVDCNHDMMVYSKLNQALSIYNTDEDVGIDFDDFKEYSWLVGFDCTPNSNLEAVMVPSLRTYDLTLRFKQSTPHNYDVFMFFVEDRRIILQSNNNVVANDFIPPSI